MAPYPPSSRSRLSPKGYIILATALMLTSCASPGPPQAPSLNLPQPVRDLTATRIGNTVELHFTSPANSTDKLALRGSLSGQLCRQLPHQPCLPVSARISIPSPNSNDTHNLVTWTDPLPPSLTTAPPQLLAYRVAFFSPANRSAGPSNQAFTASGPPVAPVDNLKATGSRQGTILHWAPSEFPGKIVLRREDLQSKHPVQWLQTSDSNTNQALTLDTSARPETPYRYTAQRRTTLQLATHTMELRSDLPPPIDFTLRKIYPPPAPTDLNAAAYSTESTFSVDLIWQPITETGLITPLAGYNIYRETLNPSTPRTQLNASPIPQPAFHDTTASPNATYRYSVTAVDANANQSPATTTVLEPSATP
jgi:hypothetical protein